MKYEFSTVSEAREFFREKVWPTHEEFEFFFETWLDDMGAKGELDVTELSMENDEQTAVQTKGICLSKADITITSLSINKNDKAAAGN